MTRLLPGLIGFGLAIPVLAGLLATLAPAFGYFPALGGTQFNLRPFVTLLAMPGLSASIALSFVSGLATTAIALSLVMLFFAAAAGTAVMRRLQWLLAPLLAVPHAAAALGLAFLIAPSGLIVRLLSPEITAFTRPPDWQIIGDAGGWSMMAALIVKEVPFLFLMGLAALPQLPLRPARMMIASFGYSRMAGFLIALGSPFYAHMRLPVLAVLAYAGSSVDVAVILGPSLPAPLSVRVSQWMLDADLQMRFVGSAGAILQFGVTLASIALWLGLERLCGAVLAFAGQRGLRLRRDRMVRIMLVGGIGLPVITVLAGIATLVLWSVARSWNFPDTLPSSLTLKHWMQVVPQIGPALTTTLLAAALAAAIALMLAILLLNRLPVSARNLPGWLQALLFVPLLLPQIGFVFGLQLLALTLRIEPGLALLVSVHLIFVFPYVVLSLSAPWMAFDRRLEIIAGGLGASPLSVLVRVRLPMLLRPCLTAFAVGFAVSIGLYLPTLLIGAGRLTTVTTEAVALAAGGDRRLIGVYALVQALLPFAGFAVAALLPQLLFRRRRAMRT